MKARKMIYFFITLIVLLIIASACTFAKTAAKSSPVGVAGGRLRPCPSTPNCVCSEFQGSSSHILPIPFSPPAESSWKKAVVTVQSMGGKVMTQDNDYLHATFTSKLFRFVDDFELRLDREQNVIHVRSASRTGYSDLGVNRKRVEQFRSQFDREEE